MMTKLSSIVPTDLGLVEGVNGKRTRKGTISWKGIPFAAPPIAGNRLRAPQPATPWPGVRPANAYGKAAVQAKRFTAVGPGKYQPIGEDCLTLNVFSPDTVRSTPRPVMVFIHGGAYILGTTATPLYDGSALARTQDVVVVTVQYRFGPFGYLDFSSYSTDERTFDSNVGIRDHLAALEWVQRNIAAFGGDPGNVTIFGESAGGSAVLALLASPASKGLFHAAIAQSPAPELVVEASDARLYADAFLRILESPEYRAGARDEEPITPERARQLLTKASAADLHKAGARLLAYAKHTDIVSPVPYGPVIGDDILPEAPLAAAQAGKLLPVPLIIGTNNDEGLLFAKTWNILPPAEKTVIDAAGIDSWNEISALYEKDGPDGVRLSADAVFWAPSVTIADGHSAVAPTYVYRYDFATKVLEKTGFGATHAMELFAVFGAVRTALGAGIAVGSWRSAERVTRTVQRHWGNFALVHTPVAGWPKYTTNQRRVLLIDDPCHVRVDPGGERRQAWQKAHAARAH